MQLYNTLPFGYNFSPKGRTLPRFLLSHVDVVKTILHAILETVDESAPLLFEKTMLLACKLIWYFHRWMTSCTNGEKKYFQCLPIQNFFLFNLGMPANGVFRKLDVGSSVTLRLENHGVYNWVTTDMFRFFFH